MKIRLLKLPIYIDSISRFDKKDIATGYSNAIAAFSWDRNLIIASICRDNVKAFWYCSYVVDEEFFRGIDVKKKIDFVKSTEKEYLQSITGKLKKKALFY